MSCKRVFRRDLLRISMLASAGAALAACAQPTPEPKVVKETVQVPVKETVQVKVKETVVVQPTAAPVKQVQLEVWHTVETEFDAIIPRFQLEHPNVKIRFQYYPWGEYFQKLEIAYAGGKPPDVHRQDDDEIPAFAERGVLLPLEEHLLKKVKKEDIAWSVVESTMIGGHLWVSIPATRVGNLWYNKKLFDEAGVPYPPKTFPSNDWTWDKFVEVCRKLTKPEKMQYGFLGADSPDFIVFLGRSNGGKILSDDCMQFLMHEAPMTDMIQACTDLMHKKPVGAVDPETQRAMGGAEMFNTGKVAMQYGQTRGGPATVKVPFEWDYAGLPIIAGKKPIVFAAIECHGVAKATKFPEEAAAFAVFLMDKVAQDIFAKTKTVIPINKAAADAWVKRIPQNRQILVDSAAYGQTLPFAVGFAKVQEIAWPMLAEVTNNQKTAQQAMTAAKPLCDAALKDAGGCLGKKK